MVGETCRQISDAAKARYEETAKCFDASLAKSHSTVIVLDTALHLELVLIAEVAPPMPQ
jgi:hypothetical protein